MRKEGRKEGGGEGRREVRRGKEEREMDYLTYLTLMRPQDLG